MRQVIARIDDRLHRLLKERALEEQRSMNAVITEALERAVAQDETAQERFHRRAEAAGIRFVDVEPPVGPVPTWEELDRENRGVRISDLIEADRGAR